MYGLLTLVLALALGVPAPPTPAPTGGWRVFTTGSGLLENESPVVAPDGRGGLWVGHHAGGHVSLFLTRGGLSHIRADGSVQQYRSEEPFRSCPTVNAMAPTPDGGLWLRLSGYYAYPYTDRRGECATHHGIPDTRAPIPEDTAIALGYIDPDGVPQMLPKAAIPQNLNGGLAVDAQGRLWLGTTTGVVVREADGRWRDIALGTGAARATVLQTDQAGQRLAVGLSDATIAIITLPPAGGEHVDVLAPATAPVRTVPALTFTPEGLAALLDSQLFHYRSAETRWAPLVSPIAPGHTARLAYAAGTLWAAGERLARLEGDTWVPIPAEATPLPAPSVSAIVAVDATTLALGSRWGAALLDPTQPPLDPRPSQQAFDRLWQRTDARATAWLWGPRGWSERYEPYAEGPGGTRLVRYYDKARMEVNAPSADPQAPWYVTNGLLVVELVTGVIQYGNATCEADCATRLRRSTVPMLPVAGDLVATGNPQAVRYHHFRELRGGVAAQPGARVAATLLGTAGAHPTQGEELALATADTALVAYDETTRHNIPQVFWDVLGQQPTDWLFAFGHPISEPYWTRTQIGGVAQWVLLQLFERRTLTYTPSNPAGWQVEMGNVGQHYYAWRYGDYEGPWQ